MTYFYKTCSKLIFLKVPNHPDHRADGSSTLMHDLMPKDIRESLTNTACTRGIISEREKFSSKTFLIWEEGSTRCRVVGCFTG
jgi:hypothetical protein